MRNNDVEEEKGGTCYSISIPSDVRSHVIRTDWMKICAFAEAATRAEKAP